MIRFFLALVAALVPAGALAQAWVSEAGVDGAGCLRSAPCRTFAAAVTVTPDGGSVACLDPGSYGPFIVTRNMAVDCLAAPSSVVAVSGGNGIDIPAGPTQTVSLRGLTIVSPDGSGAIGVNATGGATVSLSDCAVRGFRSGAAIGVNFAPPIGTSGRLSIERCVIEANGRSTIAVSGGILVKPDSTGGALAVITSSAIRGNTTGLIVDGNASTGLVNAALLGSTLTGNSGPAALALSQNASGALTVLRIDNSTIIGNGGAAMRVDGVQANLVVSRTISNRNGAGFQRANSGHIYSFGDNYVNGDTASDLPDGQMGKL